MQLCVLGLCPARVSEYKSICRVNWKMSWYGSNKMFWCLSWIFIWWPRFPMDALCIQRFNYRGFQFAKCQSFSGLWESFFVFFLICGLFFVLHVHHVPLLTYPTRTRCEMCSKLTIKTQESWLKHLEAVTASWPEYTILSIAAVVRIETSVSIVNFEHVNADLAIHPNTLKLL